MPTSMVREVADVGEAMRALQMRVGFCDLRIVFPYGNSPHPSPLLTGEGMTKDAQKLFKTIFHFQFSIDISLHQSDFFESN